jgi:hypothetical protein
MTQHSPPYSPRFVVVSDLPEWTVWDQERQCDLFPTKSGNRDYACRRCDEDTAHMIADALNAHTVNAAHSGIRPNARPDRQEAR